jgi:hypothetical protein
MTKKSIKGYTNPLNLFLSSDEDCASGLAFIARYFAQTFDLISFRTELIAKLKKHKYQPANRKGNEKTFHEILATVGVPDVLLKDNTLHELWQCTLLKTIVQRHRELNEECRAVDGQSLRDLRKQERQLFKDLRAIEVVAQRNDARGEAEKLYEKLERRYHRLMRLLLISTRYKGSRSELLSGEFQDKPGGGPKDEDVATKIAIYQTLEQRLQTKKAKNKGLFNILLCQLAEIIWASSDEINVSDGKNLYRAVRRSL